MKRLKLKDKYYKIIDGFDVNESSREVKYSNVKIDFTKKGIEDLPLKYQECQLVDADVEEKKASEGETIEGSSFSIDYDEDREFEYNLKGQSSQSGTPTPDSPVPINVVSGEQVVSVCGKNLFNKNNANILSGYYLNFNQNKIVSGSGTATLFISIKGGETYTISKILSSRFAIATTSTYPANNVSVIDKKQNNSATSLTITTSANAKYLCVFFLHSSDTLTEQQILDSIQIEKGNQPTTYEEYKGNDYEINLGKNLFDFTKDYNTSSNNVELLSNGIKLTNINTNNYTFTRYIILDTQNIPNTQYCFSTTININGSCQPRILIGTCDSSGGNRSTLGQVDINTNERKSLTITTPSTITSTNQYLFVNFYTQRATNGVIGDYVEYTDIQFEKGSSASNFSPYKTPIYLLDGDYIKQSSGKNLLENKVRTKTIGGITFTKNNDGSITINGTQSGKEAYIDFYNREDKNLVSDTSKTYTYSIGATNNNVRLLIGERISGSDAVIIMASGYVSNLSYTPSGLRTGQVFRLSIKSNATINNLTIYPQLEEGQLSDYEPYGKGIWYYKNNWGKVVLNGSESGWGKSGSTDFDRFFTSILDLNTLNINYGLSNYYKYNLSMTSLGDFKYEHNSASSKDRIFINHSTYGTTTLAQFKTWLSSNNVEVYYMLASPKYVVIDDIELLNQLNAIKLLNGTNNISIISNDLPSIMNLHYNFNEDLEVITEREVIYTGYVNNYTLPKMKNKLEYRELDIDLLSPLALATLRTADAIGTYNLQTLIREIIQPLIDDGFTLKELNVGNNQISVNYLTETIESSLNKLSNKFNFWWYIDKNKNIYINDIKSIFNKKPKAIYNDDIKINGLIDFTPKMESIDYFNTIDFTNVRLVTKSHYQKDQTTISGMTNISYLTYNPLISKDYINPGDEIEFEIPFIINTDKRGYSNTGANVEQGYFRLYKIINNTIDEVVSLKPNVDNQVIIPSNATITDSYNESKEFVFVKDSFFDNLIVGMKYNGSSKINVGLIVSDTALMWTKVRINDNREIEINKNIISTSGIVEKQIDMNEQWLTYEELLEISNSLIGNNNVNVEQVEILTDIENDYNVGDIISINKPNFLTYGDFIITDKKRRYEDNVDQWTFTLNNTNILESYIDLFRNGEQEEQSDKVYNLITGDYSREGIVEKYEVEVL